MIARCYNDSRRDSPMGNNMESMIDQRYREILFQFYISGALESSGGKKWAFPCPFCSPMARTDAKKKHRKAALLWNAQQHSWVFSCARQGHCECQRSKSFPRLIQSLNQELYQRYRLERYQSGTTGKGHNCPHPDLPGLNKIEAGE